MAQPVRFQVLGLLLEVDEPVHGYALAREHRKRTGRALSPGSCYRELHRLEEDGLARIIDDGRDPFERRRFYLPTDAGRREFESWLTAPPEGPAPDDTHLVVRIPYLAHVAPRVARLTLDRWEEWSEELLAAYRSPRPVRSPIHPRHRRESRRPFVRLSGIPVGTSTRVLLPHRARQAEANLELAREIRRELELPHPSATRTAACAPTRSD